MVDERKKTIHIHLNSSGISPSTTWRWHTSHMRVRPRVPDGLILSPRLSKESEAIFLLQSTRESSLNITPDFANAGLGFLRWDRYRLYASYDCPLSLQQNYVYHFLFYVYWNYVFCYHKYYLHVCLLSTPRQSWNHTWSASYNLQNGKRRSGSPEWR